jgi:ribulose-5-phosphate 4-epimerase/fuculose-1-phosphate aldolase
MELASLLGESQAILLEGHGATTVGSSLEETVMAMINLEEQARMNWYALVAAGPAHRRIPEANLDELSNLQTVRQQPHFAELLATPPATPRRNGVYAYYAELQD